MPNIEKAFKESGKVRPEKPIVFLLGDPTRYKAFQTPLAYREIFAKNVGKIDGYTDFCGDIEVRTKLAEKLSSEKWKLSQEDIVLTMGGSGALFFCIHALANKGDKILMPKPSFPLMKAFADYLNVEVL